MLQLAAVMASASPDQPDLACQSPEWKGATNAQIGGYLRAARQM
jgi:hypothetical protein